MGASYMTDTIAILFTFFYNKPLPEKTTPDDFMNFVNFNIWKQKQKVNKTQQLIRG
jgi:hypothetical protein